MREFEQHILPLIEPGMAMRMLKHEIMQRKGKRIDYLGAQTVIKQVPTVDAVTVRHEKWLEVEDGTRTRSGGFVRKYRICTGCGQKTLVPSHEGRVLFDWCPKCGAMMNGGQE